LLTLPAGLHLALAFVFDMASLLALVCVVIALVRRLMFAPAYIDARSRDAFVILGMIAGLMLAYFGMYGCEIARDPSYRAAAAMPVSGLFASTVCARMPHGFASVFWWLHAVILLAFLNYLPYSKHMHVLTAIPNCFFRSLEKINAQPREEFKKGNTYGAGRVDEFTWKALFDSYACTECGRCTDVCPAASTQKPLDPKKVIHDIKINLLKNGPGLLKKREAGQPLIGADGEGSVPEDALWACTTCGACMEVCPVFIEHVPRMVDMRRHLVQMKAKFPEELHTFFGNSEARSNPWGLPPPKRAACVKDTNAKHFEAGKTEYLYYIGCAGSYDARNRHVTVSICRILDEAGVSWGILGKDELCCGDSLRRLGNEYVFEQMALQNVKLFREKGIRKIIVQCPHCYSTFKNDYRQYGIELEVLHHTEFIRDLIAEGKLKLGRNTDLGKVVLHDSCYLGRHNGIYEAPRQAVAAAAGVAPAEMKRRRENSFCCGAGGGRMWMEESLGRPINVERTQEALKENPRTVCTSCPYCLTMFEDGLKTTNSEGKAVILDVAEIVAAALPTKPAECEAVLKER